MPEPRHDLLDLLPEVIRVAALPGSPLAALGSVADDLHAPVRRVLDGIDDVVDPFRAPDAFVPFLAGWVDLAWLTPTAPEPVLGVDPSRLRDLVAASADLSARRGTPGGLARFLHLATGVDGFEVEAVPGAFHVRVRIPPAAAEHRDLVAGLVGVLKPAHVTAEVVLPDGTADEDGRREGAPDE